MHKYGGLLRASVASATNDHRLGANEAPPAIISIFLGDQLTDVFDQIAKGGATSSKEKGTLMIGVDTLPVLPTDPGDRNRTSPFAFTGNRFEFRAPGLAAVDRRPDGHDQHDPGRGAGLHRHRAREPRSPPAREFNAAVQKMLEEIITVHGSAVFNGDGYSEDWQVEAAARGLPNLRTTLDALPELITDEAIELFSKYKVFSHREMHSRYEIALEQYASASASRRGSTLEIGHDRRSCRRPCATRPSWPPTSRRCKAAGVEADTGHADRSVDRHAHVAEGSRWLDAAAPRSARTTTTTLEAEAEHAGTGCSRRWLDVRRPPTSSRTSWPTTCGRCRRTRRCSSSCSFRQRRRRALTRRRPPGGGMGRATNPGNGRPSRGARSRPFLGVS